MLTDSQRAALAAHLRRGRESQASRIPLRPAGLMNLPLTYGTEQLLFIDRFAPGQAAYNIPFVLRLSGPLDSGALDCAVGGLVERHEALRTRLMSGADGSPVQVIDPPKPVSVQVVDLSGAEPGEQQAAVGEFIDEHAVRPF